MYDGRAGVALVRGLMAHAALQMMHEGKDGGDLVERASEETLAECARSAREPTDSVLSSIGSIVRDVSSVVDHYRRRVMPVTSQWTLLGCEVPVWWVLREETSVVGRVGNHPFRDEPQAAALSSHVDALFLDDEGRPTIWDWKWRRHSPSIADRTRNLQMAAYWGAMLMGQVLLDSLPRNWKRLESVSPDCAGGWCQPDYKITPVPRVCWVDLPSLKPYTRATIGEDDSGRATEFKKGDDRPLNKIIRPIRHDCSNVHAIESALLQRADMLDRAPVFIPQPNGCAHCECEPWCPRFDMPITS